MSIKVLKSFIGIFTLIILLSGCAKSNDLEVNKSADLKTDNTQNLLIANQINNTKNINDINIDSIKENNALKYLTINDNTANTDLDRYVSSLNNEAANIISKYMSEKHNMNVNAILSLDYNDITYVIIKVPEYGISYENKYDKIAANTYELWKVEKDKCKRLIYNQNGFNIYHMKNENNSYIMIQDNKGYIVKLDDKNNIIYESKYTGFSQSPDNKYTLIYNGDESFTVLEGDKIITSYNAEGNDDIDTFWQWTIMELNDFWWDLEFNKLYVLIGPATRYGVTVYSVDLINKEVIDQGAIRLNNKMNIDKENGFWCIDDSVFTGDAEGYFEYQYINKKFGNYLYNIRTNERIYLNDNFAYKSVAAADTKLTFTQNVNDKQPIELTIDVALYTADNRNDYINKLKKTIINTSDKTLDIEDIELCRYFVGNYNRYQIVKVKDAKNPNNTHYELWKIEGDKYERVFDNALHIFLTNDQSKLCIVTNEGRVSIYNQEFTNIFEKEILENDLLNNFDIKALQIKDYFCMKDDTNIFLTLESDGILIGVIDIDLSVCDAYYTILDTVCNYDNFYINTITGIMLYQTGPSIITYDDYNNVTLSFEQTKRSLIAVNLLNGKTELIENGSNNFYMFYIEPNRESVNYYSNYRYENKLKKYNFSEEFLTAIKKKVTLNFDVDSLNTVGFDCFPGDYMYKFDMEGQLKDDFINLLQIDDWKIANDLPPMGLCAYLTAKNDSGDCIYITSADLDEHNSLILISTENGNKKQTYYAPVEVFSNAQLFRTKLTEDTNYIIINAFVKAEEAFSWFTSNGEIGLTNNELEINKDLYYEVSQDNIKTKEDLREYIKNYFDDNTVETLMNTKIDNDKDLFIEKDNNLYCFGGFIGQLYYDTAHKDLFITKDNDNKYTIKANISHQFFSKTTNTTYNYTYEKIDDKWVFTNFVLPVTVQ